MELVPRRAAVRRGTLLAVGLRLQADGDPLRLPQQPGAGRPARRYPHRPAHGTTRFEGRFRGEHRSVYGSGRLRPNDELTVELGLRYDEHTLTDEKDWSPRINAVWAFRPTVNLRGSWGVFHQSQRPYELQVEDGITTFGFSERTEQTILGLEKSFGGTKLDLLRLEAYHRNISNPRPRWENIYEPISTFPEIEPDRILVSPDESEPTGPSSSFAVDSEERVGG